MRENNSGKSFVKLESCQAFLDQWLTMTDVYSVNVAVLEKLQCQFSPHGVDPQVLQHSLAAL